MDTNGLYKKFTVIRKDGKSTEGQKHCDCKYFVLDLTHDKHAKAMVEFYAKLCETDRPKLSEDLLTPKEKE